MIYFYIVLILVFLFIVTPIRIALSFNKNDEIRFSLCFTFLLGLIRIKAKITKKVREFRFIIIGGSLFKYKLKDSDKAIKSIPVDEEVKKTKKKVKKRKKIKTADILKFSKKYFAPIRTFIFRIFKSFSWDKLYVNGEYGVDDHYFNGLIYGTLWSVKPVCNDRIHIDLYPIFNDNIFQGVVKIKFSFRIYRMAISTFALIVNILWLKFREILW